MSNKNKKREKLKERIKYLEDELFNFLVKKTSTIKEINIAQYTTNIQKIKKELEVLK